MHNAKREGRFAVDWVQSDSDVPVWAPVVAVS